MCSDVSVARSVCWARLPSFFCVRRKLLRHAGSMYYLGDAYDLLAEPNTSLFRLKRASLSHKAHIHKHAFCFNHFCHSPSFSFDLVHPTPSKLVSSNLSNLWDCRCSAHTGLFMVRCCQYPNPMHPYFPRCFL